MERVTISDAQRDLSSLVDRVYQSGISVDLERDKQVVARISPVRPTPTLKLRDLPAFLQRLPRLGDDSNNFSKDVQDIRRDFPPEGHAWD